MKTIYDFQKGDIITKTCRARSQENQFNFSTGELVPVLGDDSFIGDKLLFLGVANGCIYFQVLETRVDYSNIFEGEIISIIVEDYFVGWDYYVDIQSLVEGEDLDGLTNEQIDFKIKEAIKNEDFELVEKLKTKKK